MIVDRLENWPKYFKAPAWRTAFEYLQSLKPDAAECEMTPISGDDVRGRVMKYLTRGPENALIEAHDRHVDIQMSLVNCEAIDWYPRASLEVHTPYDPKDDAVMFKRPGPSPVRVINLPCFFTVLFPQDAHLPGMMCGDLAEEVKKVVVKIRADLAVL
ncbi:MAG TPA: YhcH/YjgK/YiaL family protein [Candidatus Hydrogenedentes bacterium]|nr:YhcH/YjgK/YiaL family protein [Candidatus Hydrogenedentota bacterium]